MSDNVQGYCLNIKQYVTYFMQHNRIAPQIADHYFVGFTNNSTFVYCLKRLFVLWED